MAFVDLQQMKYRLGHNHLRSGAAAAMYLERRLGGEMVASEIGMEIDSIALSIKGVVLIPILCTLPALTGWLLFAMLELSVPPQNNSGFAAHQSAHITKL
jgi:hypothetical protein